MPFNGNQGAVAAADYNTTPGAVCDNTNMTGICIPSPTGPVPVSATTPLPVTPTVAAALIPTPATPFVVVPGASVVIFVVPVGCKYIIISFHTTAPGTTYLANAGPAAVGFGAAFLPGTNFIYDASSGVPAAGTIISAISSAVSHVAVDFFL